MKSVVINVIPFEIAKYRRFCVKIFLNNLTVSNKHRLYVFNYAQKFLITNCPPYTLYTKNNNCWIHPCSRLLGRTSSFNNPLAPPINIVIKESAFHYLFQKYFRRMSGMQRMLINEILFPILCWLVMPKILKILDTLPKFSDFTMEL